MSTQLCCANCTGLLRGATGESSLYNPNGGGITLCEECFLEEDVLIEEMGTNNLPDRLAKYIANLLRNPTW